MQKSVSLTATAAASLMLLAVAPAHAAPSEPIIVTGAKEVLSAKISFADLDLSTSAGRGRFDARVRAAIRKVCPVASRLQIDHAVHLENCQRTARAQAAAKAGDVIPVKG